MSRVRLSNKSIAWVALLALTSVACESVIEKESPYARSRWHNPIASIAGPIRASDSGSAPSVYRVAS